MKLNFVTDARIKPTAIMQVITHPTEPGLFGVYDTEFHAVEFDTYDREEAVQFAVHANNILKDIYGAFNN